MKLALRGCASIALHLGAAAFGFTLYVLAAPWCWLAIRLGHDTWRGDNGRRWEW